MPIDSGVNYSRYGKTKKPVGMGDLQKYEYNKTKKPVGMGDLQKYEYNKTVSPNRSVYEYNKTVSPNRSVYEEQRNSFLEAISGGVLDTGLGDVLPGSQPNLSGVDEEEGREKAESAGLEVAPIGTPQSDYSFNPAGEAKPEAEKPKPEKPKPKPVKTHPTPSKMISSAGWIADLMTQMGFASEETAETNTSRYPRQEAAVPELGLRGQPDDQWMGLLSALLEEKKRKEARSMA